MADMNEQELQRLRALAEACAPDKCADEDEQDRRLAEFHAELDPEVFLSLMGIGEELRESAERYRRLRRITLAAHGGTDAEFDAEFDRSVDAADKGAGNG